MKQFPLIAKNHHDRKYLGGPPSYLGKVFDSFARLSLDGVWVVDTAGHILEVNQALGEMLGYSRGELLTMSIPDVEAIEPPPEILQTIARIKTEGVARFERAHRRKDGVVIPVEINATFWERDQNQFFLAFIRDLSEQKLSEKNTAFHNALLRLSTAKTGRQEFLDAIVAQILEWCGCQTVGLGLASEPSGAFEFISLAGASTAFADCRDFPAATPERCLCYRIFHQQLEPQEIPLMTAKGSFFCANLPQFLAVVSQEQRLRYQSTCLMESLTSIALIPLRYQEDLLGVILMAGEAEGQVSLPAVEFLETIAPLVAEGIARHTMEDELELNLLKQGVINGLLNLGLEDFPLDELLRRSLDHLTTIPWIALESKGAVFLVDDHSPELALSVHKGMPAPILKKCARVPFSRCLCGRAASSREVQFSARCDEIHEISYPGMPPHGHYCIPIRHGERVLGVVNLYVKEGHRRSVSEKKFLTAVANTLAVIIIRREAETARHRSEQEFSLLVGNVPAIVCRGDVQGFVSFTDNKVEEMLGYSRQEFEHGGLKWTDLILPEDLDQAKQIFRRAFKGSNSYVREYRMRRRDGEIIWVQERSQILRNAAGKVDYISGVLFDISKRKQGEEALRDSINRLHQTLEGTVTALATAVETRDPYTAGHQRGVAQLACAIAAEMGFPPDRVEGIRVMGYLHDVGKIAVPAEILSKPGRLTEFEFNIVKFHAQVSYDILKEVDFPWPVALAVLQHHEKLDGSGYPQGLKGDEIIIEARILTVADVVEAMASHRPYRAALGTDRAIQEISQNRAIFYDPQVVDACLTVLRENRVEF